MNDFDYMRRAIELAKKAEGFTSPNPMVGAVIVKDGRIIGEGYHKKCGELHAERNAIKNLTEDASGATIYVTLEPCCHYGKTPPCTEAIIENNIAKVVIGSRDPNPLVAGKGAKILREHGIEVVEDFLRDECDKINPVFFHYITTKKPYVVLKYACTMDGKIATKTGDSKWISNEESRNIVHKMRHKYSAIMAGIGTVLADDPMLNCRIDGLTSPVRVILDSKLSIPLDSKIVKSAKEYRTIIAFAQGDQDKIDALTECGVELLQAVVVEGGNRECIVLQNGDKIFTESEQCMRVDIVNLKRVFDYLGEQGIDSVLVEGGGNINDSIIRAGLANQVEVFIAPKIFGGKDAKSPVEGEGISDVAEAAEFKLKNFVRVGDDIHLTFTK